MEFYGIFNISSSKITHFSDNVKRLINVHAFTANADFNACHIHQVVEIGVISI